MSLAGEVFNRGVTIANWPKQYRPFITEVFGIDERFNIISVIPGGPAEKAGLQEGDYLMSFDGYEVGRAPKYDRSVHADVFEKIGTRAVIREPMAVVVLRHGQEVRLTLIPEAVCDTYVDLISKDGVNAYADGRLVMVTYDMMDFVRSEEELATVISHEIAHNVLNHNEKKEPNAMGGTFLDVLSPVPTFGLFQNSGRRIL